MRTRGLPASAQRNASCCGSRADGMKVKRGRWRRDRCRCLQQFNVTSQCKGHERGFTVIPILSRTMVAILGRMA